MPASAKYQQELSDLLSSHLNNDRSAHGSLRQWAEDLAIEHSQYAGEQWLATKIFYRLSKENQITFFLHAIHKVNKEEAISALSEEPQRNVFDDFAKEMMGDPKFLESFHRQIPERENDLSLLLFSDKYVDDFFSSKAYAFEKCENYLRYKFTIVKRRKKVNDKTNEVHHQLLKDHQSVRKGCMGTILGLAVLTVVCWLIVIFSHDAFN